jgi:integrase
MRIATHISVHKAPPGRHNAAPGLYLIVSQDGHSRRWAFRYTKPSTRRVTELGLGSAALLTLAEAREKAHDCRRVVAKGQDPVEQKRNERRLQITFAEMANVYIAIKQPGWRSESHWKAMQLLLNRHAKSLATKRVATISSVDIELAIRPLWDRWPSQSKRTLTAISKVFDYAVSMGHCEINPADWKLMKHRFSNHPPGSYFTAMDYAHVPDFVRRLQIEQRRNVALSPYAIEFLLLTASRLNEVIGMQWSEVDFDNKLWIVPASRTKAAREHRVPLSDRALTLLQIRLRADIQPKVWPLTGRSLYKFLTKNMGEPVTIHGFRSSFRDWAGNETNFDRVTCELALGHKAGDATELAYRRSDALAKRRALMDAWAASCCSLCG